MKERPQELTRENVAESIGMKELFRCRACGKRYQLYLTKEEAQDCCFGFHKCSKDGCDESIRLRESLCEKHEREREIEQYREVPERDWDGRERIWSDGHEVFFEEAHDLRGWLDEHPETSLIDLRLMYTEDWLPSIDLHSLIEDYVSDNVPEWEHTKLKVTHEMQAQLDSWVREASGKGYFVSADDRPSEASLIKHLKAEGWKASA